MSHAVRYISFCKRLIFRYLALVGLNSISPNIVSEYFTIRAVNNISTYTPWSRDSVVGIATSYGLDDRGVGVRVQVGARIFCSPNRPDRL
jgi:hypothetical protein